MKPAGSVISRGTCKNRAWWARFIYVDESGMRHDLRRKATSKAHARELADDLASEYNTNGGGALKQERITFAQLADHYEKHYYKEAVYRDDRKIEGMGSDSLHCYGQS